MAETYTVLKEIYEVDDVVFKRRMDFLNEVLDLQEFIKSGTIYCGVQIVLFTV